MGRRLLGGFSMFLVATLLMSAPRPVAAQSFDPAIDVNVGPHPVAVAIGDINHDGYPDVVSANWGDGVDQGSISWILGNGGGTGGYHGAVHRPVSIALGDISGDGRLDIVLIQADVKALLVLVGSPAEGFVVTRYDAAGAPPSGGLRLTDLNHDGLLDVVYATQRGFQFRMGGAFEMPMSSHTAVSTWDFIAEGDLNRDGNPDFVLTGAGHAPRVWLGDGDRSFFTGGIIDEVADRVAIGDVNGDGVPDLVTATKSPDVELLAGRDLSVSVHIGDGTGHFSSAAPVALGIYGYGIDSIALIDADGDHHLDLVAGVAGSFTGMDGLRFDFMLVAPGRGNGSFLSGQLHLTTGTTLSGFASGDLNGDGHPDMVFSSYDHNLITVFQSPDFGGAPGAGPEPGGDLPDDSQTGVAVQMAELNAEIASLRSQLGTAQADLASAQASAASFEALYTSAQASAASFEALYSDAQASAASFQALYSSAQASAASFEALYSSAQAAGVALQSQLSASLLANAALLDEQRRLQAGLDTANQITASFVNKMLGGDIDANIALAIKSAAEKEIVRAIAKVGAAKPPVKQALKQMANGQAAMAASNFRLARNEFRQAFRLAQQVP